MWRCRSDSGSASAGRHQAHTNGARAQEAIAGWGVSAALANADSEVGLSRDSLIHGAEGGSDVRKAQEKRKKRAMDRGGGVGGASGAEPGEGGGAFADMLHKQQELRLQIEEVQAQMQQSLNKLVAARQRAEAGQVSAHHDQHKSSKDALKLPRDSGASNFKQIGEGMDQVLRPSQPQAVSKHRRRHKMRVVSFRVYGVRSGLCSVSLSNIFTSPALSTGSGRRREFVDTSGARPALLQPNQQRSDAAIPSFHGVRSLNINAIAFSILALPRQGLSWAYLSTPLPSFGNSGQQAATCRIAVAFASLAPSGSVAGAMAIMKLAAPIHCPCLLPQPYLLSWAA